jgi:hypothetical protein
LFKVESKEKLLVPNFTNLLKHVGQHKAKVVGARVEVGLKNFNGKCQHAQNE